MVQEIPSSGDDLLPTLILTDIQKVGLGSGYETDGDGTLYYIRFSVDGGGLQIGVEDRDTALIMLANLMNVVAQDGQFSLGVEKTPPDILGPTG